jgi:hypothetical protein
VLLIFVASKWLAAAKAFIHALILSWLSLIAVALKNNPLLKNPASVQGRFRITSSLCIWAIFFLEPHEIVIIAVIRTKLIFWWVLFIGHVG